MSLSARRAWIEISAWGRRGTASESLSARRAWIEMGIVGPVTVVAQSLSARRAWIEMMQFVPITTSDVVALRKESVDRNSSGLPVFLLRHWSLSARRAWIEILPSKQCAEIAKRRSPQGERG